MGKFSSKFIIDCIEDHIHSTSLNPRLLMATKKAEQGFDSPLLFIPNSILEGLPD